MSGETRRARSIDQFPAKVPEAIPRERTIPSMPDWALRWLRRGESLSRREVLSRYALAVALGLIAVALKAIVDANLGPTGFLSYIGAVVLASWLGGLGGGLIATVISATAQVLLFDGSIGLLLTPAEVVRTAWFVADGVLLTVVTAGLSRLSATELAARREATSLVDTVSRFKSAVDASPDAVLMFEPATLQVTYANRGAAELIGIRPEAWIGRSVMDLQPRLDERAFRNELRPVADRSVDVIRYASVASRGDGHEIPFEAVVQQVPAADGGNVMVLSARDMSERIEVQARLARVAGDERRQAAELRTVLEAMGEGVLVIDGGGQVRMANGSAAEMFGQVPEVLGDVATRLGLSPSDVPALGQASEPHLAQAADGRWFELATHVVDAGRSGHPSGATTVMALRDVTRAHLAQQAREAFIGVLSHELRTPVTTIYGYAKVFRRPKRSASQEEMLADIERESDRLYRIVEDLLALSRVEGGLTVDAEPLLLQHLADPLLLSEGHRWPKIHFEANLPPDLPAVFGDRTYVEQILRNLLSNAAKYSPADTTVTLVATATATEVVVSVLDRGAGITDEEAERLFQLYYRSPRTSRTATGAGIGLFVSRSLVAAMEGRMWAAPRPGGGSEFSFSLRRCDEDPISNS